MFEPSDNVTKLNEEIIYEYKYIYLATRNNMKNSVCPRYNINVVNYAKFLSLFFLYRLYTNGVNNSNYNQY